MKGHKTETSVDHDPIVVQDSVMLRLANGKWIVEHTLVSDTVTRTTKTVRSSGLADYEAARRVITDELAGKPLYVDESARAEVRSAEHVSGEHRQPHPDCPDCDG